MLPGPDYIYKCPQCSSFLKKESLMSGNTFGAAFFSDGKRIAPMLPESPDLTRCKRCGTFFWLSRQKYFEVWDWSETDNQEWKNAEIATFPDIEGYFSALHKGLANSSRDQIHVRQRIWWAYNDRVRNGDSLFLNEKDEERWKENCEQLIQLIQPNDLNRKIMLAELKRNLGDFDACTEIISAIEDSEFDWLKEAFLRECKNRNTRVFKFNSPR